MIHFWIRPETFESILGRPMWVLSLSRQFQNCFRARQHCRLIYLQILRQQCFLLSAYIFYAPKLFRRHAEELSGIRGLCILPLDIFRNNCNMRNIYSEINCLIANGQEACNKYSLVYFPIINMFKKYQPKFSDNAAQRPLLDPSLHDNPAGNEGPVWAAALLCRIPCHRGIQGS